MYMWPIAPTVLGGQMKVQWLVPRVIVSVDTHGPRMLDDQNGAISLFLGCYLLQVYLEKNTGFIYLLLLI